MIMIKRTKIVATLSVQRCTEELVRSLFKAGMNIVRINSAHASLENAAEIIRMVRSVSNSIPVMLDTKGPEIRVTRMDDAYPDGIRFAAGDRVKVRGTSVKTDIPSTREVIYMNVEHIVRDVPAGATMLIADGEMELHVEQKSAEELVCRVMRDCTLRSRKSVNVPNVSIDLPSVTEKDRMYIEWATENGVDFIAHSFVRSARDVEAVQAILDSRNSGIKIISKIENQEGIDNIDEIIDASYGIMIARGDLGIEVPIEQIPGIQRRIIEKCIRKHKPVIVATQMLHTMINNPRPTRAEVTDIANAVFSHTDALMLSGETANGKYPLEAVQTMARVAEQAEQDAHREGYLKAPLADINQREFLSKSAIEATEYLGVKGIITDSGTGETARTLASFRGPNPVLAICYKEKLQRWLNLSYGIIAIHQQQHVTAQYMFTAALRMLRQKGFIGEEDKIAYLSGSLGKGNGTTFLEINQVKEVFNKHYRFHLPDTGI